MTFGEKTVILLLPSASINPAHMGSFDSLLFKNLSEKLTSKPDIYTMQTTNWIPQSFMKKQNSRQ